MQDHSSCFAAASGRTTFDITVSSNPNHWFYEFKIFESPRTNVLSDLHVVAIISPEWADPPQNHPWQKAPNPAMIVLGVRPIPAPAPASHAWRVAVGYHLASHSMTAIQTLCYCLALGEHAIITDRPDPQLLIDHIVRRATARLNGTPPHQTLTQWSQTLAQWSQTYSP